MEEILKEVDCLECGAVLEPRKSEIIDGTMHTEYECNNPRCVQRTRKFTVPTMLTARETWRRS